MSIVSSIAVTATLRLWPFSGATFLPVRSGLAAEELLQGLVGGDRSGEGTPRRTRERPVGERQGPVCTNRCY